jgi:lipopolysaccharide/colanic/teichoic acid biosynthesis glycosyltransferase
LIVKSAPFQAINIDPGYLRAKRLLDIVLTLLLLIPICIVIVIVALLIRLDSPGPIFYRQKRVGLRGVEFSIFKFRSMYVNSDDSVHRDAIVKYMNGQEMNVGTAAAIKFQF